jgi:type I restriction enzyme S subunit
MATSQDFVNWVCSERLSSKYLYWALKASKDEFNKEKQGATHKTIYMPTVKRFQVLLPPLAEQRRIAGILDAADAIRRKRQQAIALTEQFLRSTFLDMFGDPVTNPKGWPIVLMKDLFAISPNYGTMVVPNDESGEYLDLRVANIQNGILDLTSRKYVDLEANVVQRHQVLDGDILLARAIGSKEHLGKCFVAHPGTEKWAFDSHLMRIRLNLEVVHPQFLQSYLASPGGRYEFLKHTRRSAVQFNVNTKEIAKVRVPLPPIEKQSEYIAIRKANARTKRHHEVLVQELNNLFNSLVQRAFKGEL